MRGGRKIGVIGVILSTTNVSIPNNFKVTKISSPRVIITEIFNNF